MSETYALKKGQWAVLSSGNVVQVEKDYTPQWVDSVWDSKEVAEIRAGIVKYELSQLLTIQKIVENAVYEFQDQLSKSHIEAHKNYLKEFKQ